MTSAAEHVAASPVAGSPASQAFYHALRNGCNRIGEQKSHLSLARDTLQHLQLHPLHHASTNQKTQYTRAVNETVQAWQCAVECYLDVFTSLAHATAADSTNERQEAPAHSQFMHMAKSASEALEVVKKFASSNEFKGNAESASLADEVEDEVGDEAAQEADGSGADDENAAKPEQNTESRLQMSRDARRRKRRREKYRELHRESLAQSAGEGARPGDATKGTVEKEPTQSYTTAADFVPTTTVEYEDISDEVEARLKLKEEKKARKRTERKRKRESGDSVEYAMAASVDEKPEKKKIKAVNGDMDPVDVREYPSRKRLERDTDDMVDDSGRKKRQKSRD
ncbi:hypothetical protein BDY17DRAFT_291074 [Neohortaea acidophila]|uniref:Uncharacterized protein n=1 Tax=Neohortaea acidophila TaxID=245834 RepID=A0A6A6Q2F6_9PEZI|nr:uncharacterized protein BDY17DRAFT_291074 [Neohortaea acidophila]KAF2486211.1 hypothetical protein BDY17DRAFT_291074 [Neohortaea acidophila]